jgi:hypothetical protein
MTGSAGWGGGVSSAVQEAEEEVRGLDAARRRIAELERHAVWWVGAAAPVPFKCWI